MANKKFSWSKRKLVWDKSMGKCWYCGIKTVDVVQGITQLEEFCIDHFVPITSGGGDEIENLVPCCRRCNAIKNNRSLDRFRYLMENQGEIKFSEEQVEYLKQHGFFFPKKDRYIFFFEKEGLP